MCSSLGVWELGSCIPLFPRALVAGGEPIVRMRKPRPEDNVTASASPMARVWVPCSQPTVHFWTRGTSQDALCPTPSTRPPLSFQLPEACRPELLGLQAQTAVTSLHRGTVPDKDSPGLGPRQTLRLWLFWALRCPLRWALEVTPQSTPPAGDLLPPQQPQGKGPCSPPCSRHSKTKKKILHLASILKTVLFSALFLFRINSSIKLEQKDGRDFHVALTR